MKRGVLLVFLVVCAGVSAAQLKGKFHLPKQSYASGEPVVLYFEVTNSSRKPFNIRQANPYTFCSGNDIRLSSDPSEDSTCGPRGGGGSGAFSSFTLKPGETRTEHIVLNYDHEIRVPGEYEIIAVRRLPYSSRATDLRDEKAISIRNKIRFRVETVRVDSAVLHRLVSELDRGMLPGTTNEAALTLASLGPRELEDRLLRFADDPRLHPYAPLAFHRLNTPRSMAALAKFLSSSRPGSPEHHSSASYLGQSEDPKWFPILREFTLRNPNDGAYAYPAAQAGGDAAVPFFAALIRGPHNGVPISALAYTGSREAIPILLDLLKGLDTNNAGRALYALEHLTHFRSGAKSEFDNPQSQYSQWSTWWTRSGASARIYKSSECGEFAQLP